MLDWMPYEEEYEIAVATKEHGPQLSIEDLRKRYQEFLDRVKEE